MPHVIPLPRSRLRQTSTAPPPLLVDGDGVAGGKEGQCETEPKHLCGGASWTCVFLLSTHRQGRGVLATGLGLRNVSGGGWARRTDKDLR